MKAGPMPKKVRRRAQPQTSLHPERSVSELYLSPVPTLCWGSLVTLHHAQQPPPTNQRPSNMDGPRLLLTVPSTLPSLARPRAMTCAAKP